MTDHTTKIGCHSAPASFRQTPARVLTKTLPARPAHQQHLRTDLPPTRTRKRSNTCAANRPAGDQRWQAPAEAVRVLQAIDWHARTPVQLPIDPRAPLMKLDTVMAARGEQPYVINKHVEYGVLRWVFNIAINPETANRDLRFWSREISLFASNQTDQHAALRTLHPKFVIDKILGIQREFRTNEVCLLLGIRRSGLVVLRKELEAAGRQFITRENLEQFLIRRLVK